MYLYIWVLARELGTCSLQTCSTDTLEHSHGSTVLALLDFLYVHTLGWGPGAQHSSESATHFRLVFRSGPDTGNRKVYPASTDASVF